MLYEKTSKNEQDVYLVRFISPCPIMRERSRATSMKPQRNKYFVTFFFLRDSKRIVKVCKKFFLAALGLGKHRVNTIASKIYEGKTPHDNRGGDRKSAQNLEKKESVKKFLAALPAKESHYNRKKSRRAYLSYELNIRKLWGLYNTSVDDDLKVTETMFRRVFENDFNIGFSSPSCDVCSTCEVLKNKQKIEKDPQELQSLKVQLRVHKIRAKRFFELVKTSPENSLTICFDLQQIQCLPKTPIQESFYLRQIGLYAFCVTDIPTKEPHFFIWTENQAKKGSTEIASALLTYLNSADLLGVEVLRLFADGCGGQNKNSHVVHMLMFWLKNYAPANVAKIVLTFPVRGHSFLPADRVFGRVEKDLRKKPFILNPETYQEIYTKHGKVHKLAEDWNLYDFKQLESYYKKVDNIRDAKLIIIERKASLKDSRNTHDSSSGRQGSIAPSRGRTHQRRGRGKGRERSRGFRGRNESRDENSFTHIHCGVKVSNFYNVPEDDLSVVSLLKSSQNHPSLLRRLPMVNEIKQQKKKDVEQILTKQFGDQWSQNPELEWFKTIISNETATTSHQTCAENNVDDDDVDSNVEECDCCEPDRQDFV